MTGTSVLYEDSVDLGTFIQPQRTQSQPRHAPLVREISPST